MTSIVSILFVSATLFMIPSFKRNSSREVPLNEAAPIGYSLTTYPFPLIHIERSSPKANKFNFILLKYSANEWRKKSALRIEEFYVHETSKFTSASPSGSGCWNYTSHDIFRNLGATVRYLVGDDDPLAVAIHIFQLLVEFVDLSVGKYGDWQILNRTEHNLRNLATAVRQTRQGRRLIWFNQITIKAKQQNITK